MGEPATTLRYFSCRGRAEPLRMMLHDTGTPFNDHAVPLGCAEWKEQRTLSSFAGPFGQLPVLEWEDKANDELVTVVQTLAIAQYLSFQVDPVLRAQSPSEANTTKALTYGCCAYEDLLLPIFDAVADPSVSVRVFGVNVPKVLERFDELLSIMEEKLFELSATGAAGVDAGQVYLLGSAPAWPDYVLFHALSLICEIASPTLLCHFPNVEAFRERMAARPNLHKYIHSGAQQTALTECAKEDEHLPLVVEKLRARGLLGGGDDPDA